MSKQALETRVVKHLTLLSNKAEETLASRISRSILQDSDVNQCLVVNNRALNSLAAGFQAAIGQSIDVSKYKSFVKAELKRRQQPFPDTPAMSQFGKLLRKHRLNPGSTVLYFGKSFKGLKTIIHNINKDFVKKFIKTGAEYSPKSFSDAVHLDHGTVGAPVSALGGVSAAMYLGAQQALDSDTLIDLAKYNFDVSIDENFQFLTDYELKQFKTAGHNLLANWKSIINSKTGKLHGNLSILIEPVDAKFNIDTGRIEKEVYNTLLQSIADVLVEIDYLSLEGSSSIKDKVGNAIIIDTIAKQLKGRKTKVKIDPKLLKANKPTNTKVKKKIKGKTGSLKGARNKQTSGKLTKERKVRTKRSLVSIINLINTKLPGQVAKNMVAPALQLRTGRFASSVRIIDAVKTPKGFLSLGYTYQKSPYQVFEPSLGRSPWNTPERDPKLLINKSIREIAVGLIEERFFTRRV